MKALFDFIALSLICSLAIAAPKTLTSTVTVIPFPLHTLTLHPTNRRYESASGTGGLRKANTTLLSITLNYHTTTSTQTIFATAASLLPPLNATLATVTVSSPITFNGTSIPVPYRNTCTPDSILCDSQASYSLCVPLLTSSTRYISIGLVPDGTMCIGGNIDGRIEGTCTPTGTLHCNADGLTYFSCVEGVSVIPSLSIDRLLNLLILCIGGLKVVGNMPSETMCLGGTIVGY